ncbi:BAG family molecular chaperone regulator 2-like [Impatiens glandulifera]|uniref:BAG family molecular chaperone regulator 2-like n=1 Tax=Impatiens glandulifera TaxID=253017 RepID=UPI001FB092D8|nr:BAG family molecular chaperone regulator 2-like [Impatiens glandulifera]
MFKNQEMMYKNNAKPAGIKSPAKQSRVGDREVRPGGMLVQKRTSDQNSTPIIPTIKVTVKYGQSCFDMFINPHASFGDLKKMVAGQVGLMPQDQKMFFMKKERDSRSFLDIIGVKDGSQILLVEDEDKKPDNLDKASQTIAQIGYEIDKLVKEVTVLEDEIESGKRVVEKNLLNLIEQLMTQLIKLDGISADGDVKQNRRMQVKRVQKYIEILDELKIKNASNQNQHSTMYYHKQMITKMIIEKQLENNRFNDNNNNSYYCGMKEKAGAGAGIVTTKWGTFDKTIINSGPIHALGRF